MPVNNRPRGSLNPSERRSIVSALPQRNLPASRRASERPQLRLVASAPRVRQKRRTAWKAEHWLILLLLGAAWLRAVWLLAG